MKNIIMRLESINYTSVDQEVNYRQQGYNLLEGLNKSQLQEIIQIEDIWLANKNGNMDYLKDEIVENLVCFKNDRQVLGCIAAKSYWE